MALRMSPGLGGGGAAGRVSMGMRTVLPRHARGVVEPASGAGAPTLCEPASSEGDAIRWQGAARGGAAAASARWGAGVE